MSNMMASVERVVKTYPIIGADNIEMAQVLDYHVVTKKNEFHENDLVIYVRVDSILPDGLSNDDKNLYEQLKKEKKTSENVEELESKINEILKRNTHPEFEFLRKDKFTIKAKKYSKFVNEFGNKIISEGIIFPMTILTNTFHEGQDVTNPLGILKVLEDENEVIQESKVNNPLMRFKWFRRLRRLFCGEKIKGDWADFLPPKSDEENVQRIFSKLVQTSGREGYVVSEKLEGNNISFYRLKTKNFFGKSKINFGVCSRNIHKPVNDNSDFWQAVIKNKFPEKLAKCDFNVLVRGERCAPRVQGNIYKLPDDEIFIFDVWLIDEKRFLNYEQMIQFCEKYGFKTVPFLDVNFVLPETVTELLEYSNGKSVLYPTKREGVVIRKRNDCSISFKVKSPEYKL